MSMQRRYIVGGSIKFGKKVGPDDAHVVESSLTILVSEIIFCGRLWLDVKEASISPLDVYRKV